MNRPELSLSQDIDATFAWWRAAGVDCDFADEARKWLADEALAAPDAVAEAAISPTDFPLDPTIKLPQQRIVPVPAPVAVRRNLLGDAPPPDLPAFREWWLTEPGLDTARAYPRIAPRGEAGAELMVLVPQPEERDGERLLDGSQGRLLANILAAMGLAEQQVYVASALPSHTPLADMAARAAAGMDAVLRHHIALVRPRRLLALGIGLVPMLADRDEASLREINHAAGKVPVMMSETLDALMDMPRLKARFWRRWMEWSASH